MAEIRVNATGELKLYDSDDSNYVSFKSGGTVSSNVTWTLPTADGSNGQTLTTNGSGTLSWATASSADPSSADGDSLGTASAEWSDLYLADGGIIYLGNDQDIKLTHNADKGLIIKHAATADDKPVILTLQTGETDLAANDVIGKIEFQAPDEGTGTDAILVSGAIQAVAEGNHSSSSNATRLEFMVGSSEAAAKKMQLTSAGKLEVDGGIDIEGGAVFNEDSADVDFRVESNGNANMLFVDGGSNLVGVGGDPDLGTGLHIRLSDTGATASNNAPQLVIEHGTTNEQCGISILSKNDMLGNIFFGDDGDDDIGGIRYNHDGNHMLFVTNASEAVRIGSDGHLNVGTSGLGSQGILQILGKSNERMFQMGVTSNGTAGYFKNASNSDVGNISVEASATAFNTSSDYRLKENVNYDFDATTRLKQLKPARFNWIIDDTNTLVDGFLAHEVSSIVPESITGNKDATETKSKVVLNSTGNVITDGIEELDWTKGKSDGTYPSDSTWEASKSVPVYQYIDQSKLVPLLVKTIQELEARIKTLEG